MKKLIAVEDKHGRLVLIEPGDAYEWFWPTPASGPRPYAWAALHPVTDEIIHVRTYSFE